MQSNITPVQIVNKTATQIIIDDSGSVVGVFDNSIPPILYTVPQFAFQLADANGTSLYSDVCALTVPQWNSWGSGSSDSVYVLTCVLANLGLTVAAPVISSPSSVTAAINQPFSFQIVASNNHTSYSVDSLPPGLVLDPVAGTISGTPTATGSYTSNLSVANLTVVTQALSITVQ